MLIDWFTTAAQIINFLVLVYLLRHFLYQPILRTIEEREKMFLQRQAETEQKQSEAEQEIISYRGKIQELDEHRAELVGRAQDEAEEQKRRMIRKARAEVEELRELWRETVREEQEAFLHELRLRAGTQLWAIAGRVLSDLADSTLEQRMIELFVRRSRDLDAASLARIRESLSGGGEGISVTSSFELPSDARRSITRAVHRQLEEELAIPFSTSPELICGIELRAGGYAIGWNLNDYLKSVEEEARAILEEGTRARQTSGEEQ